MINNQLQSGDVIDRYVLERPLGVSAYDSIWKALDYRWECEVAIKMVSIAYIEYSAKKYILGCLPKIGALESKLRHNNIVPHTDCGIYKQWLYIVMPYCKNGSIINFFGKTPIKENQCWLLLHDISAGLSHLKQNCLPCQNIKPENVLIGDDGRFMLSCYGVERFIILKYNYRLQDYFIANFISNYDDDVTYKSPELFSENSSYTPYSGIWAVGAVLYELMSGGSPPFEGNGGVAQLGGVKLLIIEGDYSDKLKRLVYKCLSLNPEDRPSLCELASTYC